MRCSELITKLANRGVVVQLDESGDKLRIVNFSRVLPAERLALEQGKASIIRYLQNRAQETPSEPVESGCWWLCPNRNQWVNAAVEHWPKEYMGRVISQ